MKKEDEYEKAVETDRNCVHCAHTWKENLTNEEIRKTILNEPIGICPKCQLPT